MKKTTFYFALSVITSNCFAQNSNPYPSTGSLGLGTATPAAGYQLQVHGTTTYTSQATTYIDWEGVVHETVPGSAQGITSRIGLTNTTCGAAATDGGIIRQSGYDLVIQNLEKQNLVLQSNRSILTLQGNGRANFGQQYNGSSTDAAFNIKQKYDNGLLIENASSGYYGMSVKVKAATDNALLVYTVAVTAPVFTMKGNGITELYYRSAGGTATNLFTIRNNDRKLLQVSNDGILRSREIIVDALTWADYVFEPAYDLMSLEELEKYIAENKHLPNVPSTADVERDGVNLAKTDAILLEKIEELTLYLLQQDEKMKALQAEVEQLKKASIEK